MKLILDLNNYNPFKKIFETPLGDLPVEKLYLIMSEMEKGGIVIESSGELDLVITLLREVEKEIYGKE